MSHYSAGGGRRGERGAGAGAGQVAPGQVAPGQAGASQHSHPAWRGRHFHTAWQPGAVHRRLARFALVTLAVAALSGCLRFEADLTVNADDTVDGSYIVALEEGTGAAMGGSDTEVAKDIFDDSGLQTQFEHQWIHDYRANGFAGVEVEFRDEPLASFAPTVDRFGITRDGDDFVVSGKASSTVEDDAAGANPEMTVTIAFPGPVKSANGKIDGNAVTWNLVGGPPELEARASAIPVHSPWPAILVTALVLVAAAVTFWPREAATARRSPGTPRNLPSVPRN